MNRTTLAAVFTLLALAPALAQQASTPPAAPPPPDFSKVEIKTTDLGDGVYMLEGQGGNMTLATANRAPSSSTASLPRCTTRSRRPSPR